MSTTETSAMLEERVARQEAAEEVRALVAAYAGACDAQDLHQLEAIFGPKITLSVPGATWTGTDEVLGFYRDAWAASPHPSRHFITNVALHRIEPDYVEATSYFLYISTDDREAAKIGWGSYHDCYGRDAGRMKMQSKHIAMDPIVDLRDGWGAAIRRPEDGLMTSEGNARLAGRAALITGAGSGLGAATARRFVAEGARVVIADLQADRGQALSDELGDAAQFVLTDVTDEASVAAAVDAAVSAFGRLDIMFNNAGIIGAIGPVATLDFAEFDFTVAVNLRGVAMGMKHAARVMVPQGSGVILSTTSVAGIAGGLGPHVYSATKGGVIALTLSVAAELRPKGIRVNAIMPGAMVTQMTADLTAGDPDALEEARTAMASDALMSRPGHPDDIAAAALYLASDDAAFVTAAILPVDAGMTGAPGNSPYATAEFTTASLIREGGRRGTAR